MVFDIESFYPSISEKLFNDAIQYAKRTVEIPDHDMIIINHSRKGMYSIRSAIGSEYVYIYR